ncbi:MAG: c(7)-type cytochrome triheme domain-containing protein [Nitrospirota bacterium]
MTGYSVKVRLYCAVLIVVLAMSTAISCIREQTTERPAQGTQFDAVWNFPPLPPPPQYGNVLISRLTRSSTHPPVSFSHWLHRRYYTCRVCHFELGFAMKTNTTEITEAKNRKGDFCGSCHNGKIAFPIDDSTCRYCHTGTINASDARFSELKELPKAKYGDEINWVRALKKGFIAPKQSLIDPDFEQIPFEKILRLEPEWKMINTRALFPHKKHTEWLDCADCHPDIFNIQKKGTKHFRMDYINDGKFCGVCHLTVAFPIQDCKRCHPDLN